jgi:CHASE3 domain sensor protein
VRGGLTGRLVVGSGLLMLLVGGAFAVLLVSVADLRTSARLARHSEEVLVAANQLERLIVDLETGQRGFVITAQERFLQPWQAARVAIPGQATTLERLTVVGDQHSRARRIIQAATSYLRDYSIPLVAAARRDPASARTVAATEEGKRRVDAMRVEFDGLVTAERGLGAMRQGRADAAARQAIVAASAGLAGSVLLIGLFAGYLTRAIVRPVLGAAGMAGRLAGGDLQVRMPETGVGEGGSSAICTTASSSGWCRWHWTCVPPRPACQQSTPSLERSSTGSWPGWGTRWTSCAKPRVASTRRPCRRVGSARR